MKCAVLVLACVAAFTGAASTPARSDPGGLRDGLAERGIVFGFNYIGDIFDVARGGISRGGAFDGRFESVADVNLETLLGWSGAAIHANAYAIHGDGPSAKHVGNMFAVSNAEATPSLRLFEIWIEQSGFDDKLKIRFGQLAADTEFFISDTAALFLNGTFGWPGITSNNMKQGGPAYPFATPGVRLAFLPSKSLTLLAGLYNGSPADPAVADPQHNNRHGLNFRIDSAPLVMLEAQYKYDIGLPGTVKFGGWKQFGGFADQRTGARVDGDDGLYAIVDQQIWSGGAGAGVSVFGRISGGPQRQNLIGFYADAGVVATGLMPGRAKDSFGVAFGYGEVSDQARAFDTGRALPVIRDYEAVLEINYQAEIMPGWTLSPDFQYVWHPGGHIENPLLPGTAIGDAAVFGVRSKISY
jgi:porin